MKMAREFQSFHLGVIRDCALVETRTDNNLSQPATRTIDDRRRGEKKRSRDIAAQLSNCSQKTGADRRTIDFYVNEIRISFENSL